MSRLSLVLLLVVATVALCAGAPRQKRGFRNAALSTARGFGKRMSEAVDDQSDLARPIGTDWLADQLSRHRALAKLLVEKLLDQNGDGMINQDEMFQPL